MNGFCVATLVSTLFVVIIDIDHVHGYVTLSPNNAAAQLGANTTFACRIDSTGTAHWLLNDFYSKDNVTYLVYDGRDVTASFAARFRVTTGSGFFNLTVIQTQKTDAGHYTCREVSTGKSVSALYTIIISSPVCSTSPPSLPSELLWETQVNLSCRVVFNGSEWQRPFQRWLNNDEQVADSSQVELIYDYQGRLVQMAVVSELVIVATPPNISYVCQTYFREPIESADQPRWLSQTVPQYVHRCDALTAMILYPPEDTVISGMTTDNTIQAGGALTCTAQGYPAVRYTWTDWTQGSIMEDKHYEVGDESRTLELGCSAANNINGVTYTDQCNITIEVIGSKGHQAVASYSKTFGVCLAVALIMTSI